MRVLLWLVLFGLAACCTAAAVGCNKPAPVPPPPAPKPSATVPTKGDDRNTNYKPGGGVVGNVRRAGLRTAEINDVKQLGLFIETKYTLDGKMPKKADLMPELEREAPKIAAQIKDGTIILTDTAEHGGLWAYEVDADKVGGIVLVAAAATRADADEVKKLIAAK